jgi:hypothetical protein
MNGIERSVSSSVGVAERRNESVVTVIALAPPIVVGERALFMTTGASMRDESGS